MTSRKKNRRKLGTAGILAVLFASLLTACARQGKNYRTVEEIVSDPVSIMTGTTYADIAKENGYLTEETEILEYNTELDSVEAVRSGKSGSCADSLVYASSFVSNYDDLMVWPESVGSIDYAYGFAKGSPLRDEFNRAMARLKAEGMEERLAEKWLKGTADGIEPEATELPGAKGTLRYWVNTSTPPMAYVADGGVITGYSVDLVTLVAREMGYSVEVTECSFSGLIPALNAGRADIAGRSMVVTEERKKSIDFSDPFITSDVILLVRKEDVAPEILSLAGNESSGESRNIFEQAVDGFIGTFVTENRWKMFVDGIGVTMLITVLSAVAGTVFGLLSYVLFSRKNSVFNTVLQTVHRWVSGIPTVVVLMIMYYVILCQTPLSGVAVSVITFTVLFAISVFGLITTGVEAVSKGQIEAAADLGFTEAQIFTRIVFPQAALYVMPLYRSKVVEHLKATSIVGYIAVLDLTKISDMVRSRTFEAFFPLLATAVIYYFLGRVLDGLLKRVEDYLRPGNHGSSLLKGVKRSDQN